MHWVSMCIYRGLEKRAGSGGLGQIQTVTSWSHLSAFKGAHIHVAHTHGDLITLVTLLVCIIYPNRFSRYKAGHPLGVESSPLLRWWFEHQVIWTVFTFTVIGPTLTFYVTQQSIKKWASKVAATAQSTAAIDEFICHHLAYFLFVCSAFGVPKWCLYFNGLVEHMASCFTRFKINSHFRFCGHLWTLKY